jgi:DNA-directed RNA polymerase subunit beta'
MTLKELERVLYFENYMVTEPGLTPLKMKQLADRRRIRQGAGRIWRRQLSPP